MSPEDADDPASESSRDPLWDDASPELPDLVSRFITLGARLGGHGEVTKLDAAIFTSSNTTPAEMAAICRGQAALLRESAAMQEEMAELHDRLGAYFEGEAGRD